jgi:hypothetical protein
MTKKAFPLLPLLLVSLLGPSRRSAGQAPPPSPQPEEMSTAERRVRHAYMKLMRYQSAEVDEDASKAKRAADPESYVTFGVTVLKVGALKDIVGKPLGRFVSPRDGSVLGLTRQDRKEKDKQAVTHVAYNVRWKTVHESGGGTVSTSLGSCPAPSSNAPEPRNNNKPPKLTDYVAYAVTVQLGGKQRVYKALALHSHASASGQIACMVLVDKIAKGVDAVVHEEQPAIRSPWKDYVRSPLYKAIVDAIRHPKHSNEPQPRHNTPPPPPIARSIGWLLGDDAAANFGAAGFDSDFQPALFARGGCCINNPPRFSSSLAQFFGEECQIPIGVNETGQLEMSLNWTVRWPDGQSDETNVNGSGECANAYTCPGGTFSPPTHLYCWPRFPTPEVTTVGTTQTLSVTVEFSTIQFDPAVLICEGKLYRNPLNRGGDLPSVCTRADVVLDHVTHDCQACCGEPGGGAPAPAEEKTAALEIVSTAPLPHGGLRVSLHNRAEKAITAFSLGWHPDADALERATIDLLQDSDPPHRIAAGATITRTLPGHAGVLDSLAVVFEDGTGSGDAGIVETIVKRREGWRTELARWVPILREAVARPDPVRALRRALQRAPARVAEPGKALAMASAVDSGVQRARETFRQDLRDIERGVDPGAASRLLLERYEAQLARLRGAATGE